jgi:surface antigen
MKKGHVAWVGEMRNICNILVENSNGKNQLEEKSVDGKIIFSRVLVCDD